MTNRSLEVGLALAFLSCPTIAWGQTAQLPATPEGFVGTPFRGVALGQSRDEVTAALAALGKRCAVAADFPTIGPGYTQMPPPNIDGNPSGTCWIIRFDDPVPGETLMGSFMATAVIRAPFDAVSFEDDRAKAIVVGSDYFNSGAMDIRTFAQGVADNYDLPNGMQPNAVGGWQGLSSKGEIIAVVQILGAPILMVLMGSGAPAFD